MNRHAIADFCVFATLVAGFACFETACPRVPTTVQPDADAAPVSWAAICAHLAIVPCPEAADQASCVDVFTRASADHLTKINASCLAAASSPMAVQACGFVRCQK
jgi:hypothetical protein